MNVVRADTNTNVGSLMTGDVFKHGQCYFMKTSDYNESGYPLCINLHTGIIVEFSKQSICNVVKAELVVYDTK